MNKRIIGLLGVTAVLALAGCKGFTSHSEVAALNEAKAVGSPFTQNLAAEYRAYANSEQNDMFDYPDALHFGRKGLSAAAGNAVLPEPISDWNLQVPHMHELGAARARLLGAYERGAREILPQESAIAQARFDCWIEQQEENWGKQIGKCKSEFEQAMNAIEARVGNAPPPAPVEPAPDTFVVDPAQPMAVANAKYLVFFDFDKSNVNSQGQSIIDAAVAEIQKQNLAGVNIVGHADRSGPEGYNQRLSMRRANATRDRLVAGGVASNIINVAGRGESEPMVETADGVREPANRRAEITFQ